MHKELKEMCHEPDAKLLLGFGGILNKREAVEVHLLPPVHSELRAGPITELIKRLNCLSVNVTLEHERIVMSSYMEI